MLQGRISVVMCTYNGSAFIDEQVASVLSQECLPAEVIVQDDCSTDDTWQKLERWQQQSPLLKIYRNPVNIGYNKNFEAALQRAAGEWIALADQDDIWLPGKLARLLEACSNETVVLAHNRSVRLENGRLHYRKAALQRPFSGNDTRKLFFFNQVNGHDMLFRKTLLQQILPIPDGMLYDWWIAVLATCHGQVAVVPEFLVHHRIHGGNSFFSSHAPSKKKEQDLDEALKCFTGIPAMNPRNKAYLLQFLSLVTAQSKEGRTSFSFPFFRFLLANRKIVLGHKRRWLPIVSHIKYSIKYAGMNFRGRGIHF